MTTVPSPLREFAATVLRIVALLAEAERAQWAPSHVPQPREDTTERAQGGHGDPTLATVVDDRRLALRAAVVAAEHAVTRANPWLLSVEYRLQKALDRWGGE